MSLPRSCGVLLHPTSLPGPYGIGDLGRGAYQFLDRLHASGQSWWQMLPLNYPGHGGSPYSAESAFACNPALIDLEPLVAEGLLTQGRLDTLRGAHPRHMDTDILAKKLALLRESFEAFGGDPAFDAFREEAADWLEPFCLYMALREEYGYKSWRDWAPELVARAPDALEGARNDLAHELSFHAYNQWRFFTQWRALKARAGELGVKLIGDIPIFVAMDSADVWWNRALFEVDAEGVASVVAGVPPDYFSKTGQKWGNPLYDWARLEETGHAWWIDRVRETCATVDLARIDHFRGFEAYWEVPADAPTAETGRWVPGPGDALFASLDRELGEIPLIAEDLGLITQGVHDLRERHDIPGMKVMHFAFGGEPDHPFLPHTYPEHCVAYAGTHDNDTTRGWFDALPDDEQHRVRVYLSSPNEEVVDRMLSRLLGSRAALTIVTPQDLYDMGTSARMNTPGTVEGNWTWRMTQEELDQDEPWDKLSMWTNVHKRRTP